MEWEAHDRWASMYGIPKEVSREVNGIIDAVGNGKMISAEYERHLEDCAGSVITDRPKTGNSALDLVVTDYAKRRHDVSRGPKTGDQLAARVHNCAMARMGDKYLRAWYLHHFLDYLHENADSGLNLEHLFDCYKEDHPVTYSPEVAAFLRENRDELVRELSS